MGLTISARKRKGAGGNAVVSMREPRSPSTAISLRIAARRDTLDEVTRRMLFEGGGLGS
jgi:hypothetical protein